MKDMTEVDVMFTVSFHKAFPNMQHKLHERIAQESSASIREAAHAKLIQAMAKEAKAQQFVSQWNCTLPFPTGSSSSSSSSSGGGGSESEDSTQDEERAEHTRKRRHADAGQGKNKDKKESKSSSGKKSYGAGQSPQTKFPARALCQQSVLKDPFIQADGNSAKDAPLRKHASLWPEWWDSLDWGVKDRLNEMHGKKVVLVGLTKEEPHAGMQAAKFLTSLRRTGCDAHVVMFVHNETQYSITEALHMQDPHQPFKGNTLVIPWHRDPQQQHFSFSDNSATSLLGAFRDVIGRIQSRFDRVLHLTTLNVTFLADPFETISDREGLALFVTHDSDFFNGDMLSKEEVRRKFGICGDKSGFTEIHPFLGPAVPTLQMVMGSHHAYFNFLDRMVEGMIKEVQADRPCSPLHFMSRLVWQQHLASFYPLTVYDHVDGPVRRMETVYGDEGFRLVNERGNVYSVLIHGKNQYEHHY